MLAGFKRRWSWWRAGRAEERPGDPLGLFRYLLGHRKILKNTPSGRAHIMLFWGIIVPFVVIVLAQFDFAMPEIPSRVFSLMTDLLGIAMLAGSLFFLARRMRNTGPDEPKRTLLPIFLLVIILLTGFMAEGARLSIIQPAFAGSSPAGWLFSLFLPESPRLMQLMIRFHFFAVLLFIATLPFTFMRHLVAASLNVYYRKPNKRGEIRHVSFEGGPLGASKVVDLSWKQLLEAEACVACGRCDEHCPASLSGKPLFPRKVMRNILEQMEGMSRRSSTRDDPSLPYIERDITADEIWACTTCMACGEHCPVFIEPADKIIDMRRYQVMGRGMLPKEARPMMRNLELYGDVQGKGIAHRADWAFNREAPLISDRSVNPEILLWVGCSGAFHPGYQEVARAMVEILQAGGVQFAVLGKEELCCGDPARRLGEESLFFDLARKNIGCFQRYHVRKIVALCPHCFNTLKNEYPGLRSDSRPSLEVWHAAEWVMNLIQQNRINLKYPVAEKVAIHDPCYLGRANQVYEPLREIIRALPGAELIELRRNRESGFCCGGGGGRMWLHEQLGRHINQIRSEEVVEAGVDSVGTACPYCLTMLDDGIKSLGVTKPPRVFDIIGLVAASLA